MASKNKREFNKAKSAVAQPCYRSQTQRDRTKYKRKSKYRGVEND